MATYPVRSSGVQIRNSRRGSALLTVLLFSFLLIALATSVIQWAMTERRLNSRAAYWLEARNAAEAVAEYGAYQVVQLFSSQMNPNFSTNPISFPSTLASTFFSGSRVDTSSIDLKVGHITQVPSSRLYYIDPNDPNNQYDTLVGRYVYRRDVTVLAKATVNPPTGGGAPVTAYIKEVVSVRGAPLLAYAIFYSANDLEFNETPQMDIYGPVHVNGNLFVGPAGSNPSPLTFHGPVTASGNVFHAWRGTTTTAQEGGTGMSSTTAVNFSTDNTVSGSPFNMRASTGVWKDSTMGADSSTSGLSNLNALVTTTVTNSFRQYANQTWKGLLQTSAMGVQPSNPMGLSSVVGQYNSQDLLATDDKADLDANVGTSGTYSSDPGGYGHGYGPHSLIEPPVPVSNTDTYASAKSSIEEQKFSNKAALYFKVVVKSDGSLDTANTALYGDPNSAPAGTPSSNIGPNGGIKLGTIPSNVFQYIPYSASGSGTSAHVSTGLYDQHQDVGVNLVQVNMQGLKQALVDMADPSATTTANTDIVTATNAKWGAGTSKGYDKYVTGSSGWNGGIYIEVSSADTTRQTGVVIANGKVSSGSSLLPNSHVSGDTPPNGVDGLTIATNSPVYILGSLNTDGVVATGTSTNSALYPDDIAAGTTSNIASSVETPLAIAADAVTVLSANYFGTGGSGTNLVPNATYSGPSGPTSNSSSSSAYKSPSTTVPTVPSSGSVEIATALISGTIESSPTSSGTQVYSGGVHNFPRFLENWSTYNNTVAIRGSLVNMYKSRIATAGWSISYYSAPIRQWGFDQLFANGIFPPIIPQVLSYRRADFTYVANAAAYTTEVNNL